MPASEDKPVKTTTASGSKKPTAMKMKRLITGIILLSLMAGVVSCREKKEQLTFGTRMDQFGGDGSKVYLGHAEQWLYWEPDDQIMVCVGGDQSLCNLVSGAKTLDAFFTSQNVLPIGSDAYAFYPSSLAPTGSDASWTITLPNEQPYRTTTNSTATDPDSSFGRGAMPMVCYGDGGFETLIFHVVAGVLRIQLYSSVYTKTISSITFKEVGEEYTECNNTNKQISGAFAVHDIQYNQPWLTAAGSVTDATRTITITGINQEIGPTKLLTFYLPLPAVGTGGSGIPNTVAANTKTKYALRMTVTATDGTQCQRTLGADIHRRNLTMMPALNISDWAASPGTGSTTTAIVGSGTKDRPFQIYSVDDLVLVRNAINNGDPLNGQPIRGMNESGGPTYFKIVRSDITLDNSNWTQGIRDFKGYMYAASTIANNNGIINNSTTPLFDSISSDGKVELVEVRGSSTVAGTGWFSPFCTVNKGVMEDCHNRCIVTTSTGRHLAGVCVTNKGQIIGGANEVALTTSGFVGGVCGINKGSLQGSFALSSSMPSASRIGGICYDNQGTMDDCQVSANVGSINSSGNWGLVTYFNSGTINNCIANATLTFTVDGEVGGIAHTNTGTINGCSCAMTLWGNMGTTGGIAAYMTEGSIYNCVTSGSNKIHGKDNAGGIVGYLSGGTVGNCYNTRQVETATDAGGIIGRLGADGVVQNCWNSNSKDFVGYYETDAAVGSHCFNYFTTESGCNMFSTIDWKVTAVTNAANVSIGNYLYAALNQGRTTIGNANYWQWKAGTNNRPALVVPTSKHKGRK